jgi:streptogramin lyase
MALGLRIVVSHVRGMMIVLRTLFFALLLALVACSTPAGPTDNSGAKPFQTSSSFTNIRGQIEGWNRGAQRLAFQSTNSASSPILIESGIDATGAFNLDLPTSVQDSALNTFVTCPGVSITPNSKGLFVPFFAVKSASGAFLGAIAYTNTDGLLIGSSKPQAGSALVAWVYSNQDSTVRGSCSDAQGQSGTYDYQLKTGWNSIIVEYINATTLQFRSGETSSKLTWRFSPAARTLLLDPQSVKLEIGQTRQYTFSLQEADGTVVSEPKPIWSSTQPNVASVNGNGLVTANGLGQTQIRATLDGQTVSSTLSTFGMQVAGGTYSVSGQTQKGTAFAFRYVTENGQASTAPFNISIAGPAGWNNNQTLETTYPANSFGYSLTSNAQPISGTYTLTQDGKKSSFTVDAMGSIPTVQNVQFTFISITNLGGSYDPSGLPSGTSIEAQVFDATTGQYVGDKMSYLPSSFSVALNATLNDLHQNEWHILTRSFDPKYSSQQQYHVALLKMPLDFRPQIRTLSHTAAPSSGNVKITIYGQHFRNDIKVKFGNVQATSVATDGPDRLTVVVPAQAVGTVDVSVTTPLGTTATSGATKFKYFQMQKTDLALTTKAELVAASDGTFWYLPEYTNAIGRISDGQNRKYTLPAGYANRFGSRQLTVDQNGNAWFSLPATYDIRIRSLVKVTPTGNFSSIDLPASVQNEISSLLVGSDGKLWFAADYSKVYRVQTDGQDFTEFPLPASGYPTGLVNGPDGAVWFGLSTSFADVSRIGKITTTGAINIFADGTNRGLSGLSAGPENSMWLLQYQGLFKMTINGTMTSVPWVVGTDSSVLSSSFQKTIFDGSGSFWRSFEGYNDTSNFVRVGTDGRLARWAIYTSTLYPNGSAYSSISSPVVSGGKIHVIQSGQLLSITP